MYLMCTTVENRSIYIQSRASRCRLENNVITKFFRCFFPPFSPMELLIVNSIKWMSILNHCGCGQINIYLTLIRCWINHANCIEVHNLRGIMFSMKLYAWNWNLGNIRRVFFPIILNKSAGKLTFWRLAGNIPIYFVAVAVDLLLPSNKYSEN